MSDSINPPSALISMLACKCPRCRKGNVFQKSLFNVLEFMKTNANCPHCNLQFEHETGFYWGAMYISYGFSTALMIIFGIIAINADWSFTKIVVGIISLVLLLTPVLFRYSRILLLYLISPNRKFKKEFY